MAVGAGEGRDDAGPVVLESTATRVELGSDGAVCGDEGHAHGLARLGLWVIFRTRDFSFNRTALLLVCLIFRYRDVKPANVIQPPLQIGHPRGHLLELALQRGAADTPVWLHALDSLEVRLARLPPIVDQLRGDLGRDGGRGERWSSDAQLARPEPGVAVAQCLVGAHVRFFVDWEHLGQPHR